MNVTKEAVNKAGGAIAVARAFDINRIAVYRWTYKNQVPAERVLKLSEMSGVPAHVLRPDVFGQQKTR